MGKKKDKGGNAAAAVAATEAVHGNQGAEAAMGAAVVAGAGMSMLDKYKQRLRRVKIAAAVFCLLFLVFLAVGIVLLVFFVPKWNTVRWAAIVGIVFVLIALLMLMVFIILIVIVVKIYKSLSGGSSYRQAADLSKVNYPRQAAYEPEREPLNEKA